MDWMLSNVPTQRAKSQKMGITLGNPVLDSRLTFGGKSFGNSRAPISCRSHFASSRGVSNPGEGRQARKLP